MTWKVSIYVFGLEAETLLTYVSPSLLSSSVGLGGRTVLHGHVHLWHSIHKTQERSDSQPRWGSGERSKGLIRIWKEQRWHIMTCVYMCMFYVVVFAYWSLLMPNHCGQVNCRWQRTCDPKVLPRHLVICKSCPALTPCLMLQLRLDMALLSSSWQIGVDGYWHSIKAMLDPKLSSTTQTDTRNGIRIWLRLNQIQ